MCEVNNEVVEEMSKFNENFSKLLLELNIKKYYLRISEKLMDPITSAKTYWSILKTLVNNKKIPCIPLLFHRGKYVTGFKKKAELFNSFFVK